MKKLILIGLGFAIAITVFGIAGFAYAQAQEPPDTQTSDKSELPYGSSGWSRVSNGGRMSFGLDEGYPDPLHDYLFPAIAEAFGLTEEQIAAFEMVRSTVHDIRADLTPDEIRAVMQQAFHTAVENAIADGAITEEQAEGWLERLEWIGDHAPAVSFPDLSFRGRLQSFRQGFSAGFRSSRQMMLNHEYIDAAIAEELGISVEELQEMKTGQGFNLRDYAVEQGLSDDQIAAWRLEIFTNAVNSALADGAITQEQANWILERLENLEARGVWFGQP